MTKSSESFIPEPNHPGPPHHRGIEYNPRLASMNAELDALGVQIKALSVSSEKLETRIEKLDALSRPLLGKMAEMLFYATQELPITLGALDAFEQKLKTFYETQQEVELESLRLHQAHTKTQDELDKLCLAFLDLKADADFLFRLYVSVRKLH